MAEPALELSVTSKGVDAQRGLGQQSISGGVENIRQTGQVWTGCGGHHGIALRLWGGSGYRTGVTTGRGVSPQPAKMRAKPREHPVDRFVKRPCIQIPANAHYADPMTGAMQR